ncbi:MAG: hypothetical protein V3T54_02345, partial [Acidobacteriota bacterium]
MASLKPLPKVRTDLIKIRQVQRGVTLYIYKVPVKNLYYQIDEIQHEILELLDGTRTATELVDEFNTRDLVLPIDEDFLDTYVSSMKDMDIFEKTDEERRRIVLERIRDKRRKRITNSNIRGNIFELTFPGWNPTGFFDWALPKVKFFWTPGFVIFSAACILIMLGIWVARWQEVQEGTLALYTFKGKTAGDFLDFFLILLVIGFLHESAHGLTCRYYGGVVTQMGFVLMFFTPCFFVDVSDSYLFDKSYKRQWVIHAGIYFELFLCALATFVWALTSPGSTVNEIAYKTLLVTGISSVVVQLNPLIKLDGYFSLM